EIDGRLAACEAVAMPLGGRLTRVGGRSPEHVHGCRSGADRPLLAATECIRDEPASAKRRALSVERSNLFAPRSEHHLREKQPCRLAPRVAPTTFREDNCEGPTSHVRSGGRRERE